MKKVHALADFLGLKKSIVAVLAMVILVGMGERMAERFLPIYLMALGGGFFSIGLLNGLANLLGALYSFPGGYLSDRWGTKRALMAFNLMAMAGYLLVIMVPTWYAVIMGAFFFLSWSAISLPATMSLVAMVLPKEKRTMGVSMHSLVRRFPMALGPMVGGLFIDRWGEITGVRIAFATALLMALLAILVQQALLVDDSRDRGKGDGEKNPLRLAQYISPDLQNLLISDILVRFCEQIPYAFVVVWCMKSIAHPVDAFQFGVLTAIEMATAVLIYIPVAYYADRTGKKPFVIMTFAFFSLFPLCLYFCHSFILLVGAFILRGLKEFGEPTRKALIMDLAPEDKKAALFGLYYLIRDSIVSLAAFGGAFLWSLSPFVNFLTAFLFGCAGTLWFALKGKDLPVMTENRQEKAGTSLPL
jgi:MFS family permease